MTVKTESATVRGKRDRQTDRRGHLQESARRGRGYSSLLRGTEPCEQCGLVLPRGYQARLPGGCRRVVDIINARKLRDFLQRPL
jgi:hypothetical protein